MAEIVRRRSWGGVLPLGRHASISGSSVVQCASENIAPPLSKGAKRPQTHPVQARTGPSRRSTSLSDESMVPDEIACPAGAVWLSGPLTFLGFSKAAGASGGGGACACESAGELTGSGVLGTGALPLSSSECSWLSSAGNVPAQGHWTLRSFQPTSYRCHLISRLQRRGQQPAVQDEHESTAQHEERTDGRDDLESDAPHRADAPTLTQGADDLHACSPSAAAQTLPSWRHS